MFSLVLIGVALLHILPWLLQSHVRVLPPVSLLVIVTSTGVVFWGSMRSLKTLSEVMRKRDPKLQKREESVTLSSGDAMRVPILGSCVLLSAYMLIKFFGKSLLNTLLTVYFFAMSAAALASVLESEIIGTEITGKKRYGRIFTLNRIGQFIFGQTTLDLRFGFEQVMSWVIGIIVSGLYSKTKHYLLNNIIATCLCLGALDLISVGTFKNAAIMLCGLFVYDITWVFGADVMVTVAKGIDGPIKFLFLRKFADLTSEETKNSEFSLLGLGDIVVPGLFIAMLLRFDAHQAFSSSHDDEKDDKKATSFSKPYFYTALIAYSFGLMTTLLVMYFFDAAQPALLYLVPAILIAVLVLALLRNEFATLIAYSEEDTQKENEQGENKNETTENELPAEHSSSTNNSKDSGSASSYFPFFSDFFSSISTTTNDSNKDARLLFFSRLLYASLLVLLLYLLRLRSTDNFFLL